MLIEKRPGAPAGTITVSVAGGSFVFDDSTHAQIDVPRPTADILAEHPYLRKVGGGLVVTPNTLESYTYDSNGRVATMTAEGHTATFTYTAAGQISTITWSNGNVETWTYDGSGRLTGVTST